MNGPAPNFFLVGAPKAGTTSLYHYLDQHPQIYMSPIKEPHYFANEIRAANFSEDMRAMSDANAEALRRYLDGQVIQKFSGGPVAAWGDYRKLFSHVRHEIAIGEASTCYLWSPTAPHNIADEVPGARILMILRDPAERAFSQFRHALSFAHRKMSFGEYLDAGMSASGPMIGESYPCLHFGFYFDPVVRYLSLFSRSQIHIGFYEDYARHPHAFLRDVCSFLGVDEDFSFDLARKHMQPTVPQSHVLNNALKATGLWRLARNFSPPALRGQLRRVVYQPHNAIAMWCEDRGRLIDYYRRDVQNLACLLKRDLSAWLSEEPHKSHLEMRAS